MTGQGQGQEQGQPQASAFASSVHGHNNHESMDSSGDPAAGVPLTSSAPAAETSEFSETSGISGISKTDYPTVLPLQAHIDMKLQELQEERSSRATPHFAADAEAMGTGMGPPSRPHRSAAADLEAYAFENDYGKQALSLPSDVYIYHIISYHWPSFYTHNRILHNLAHTYLYSFVMSYCHPQNRLSATRLAQPTAVITPQPTAVIPPPPVQLVQLTQQTQLSQLTPELPSLTLGPGSSDSLPMLSRQVSHIPTLRDNCYRYVGRMLHA